MCLHAFSLSLHGLRRYELYCPYRKHCEHFLFYSINQYHPKVMFSDLSCTRVMQKNFKLFVQIWAPQDLSFGCSQRPSVWLMNRAIKLQGSKAQQEQNSSHVQVFLVCFFLSTAYSVTLSIQMGRQT